MGISAPGGVTSFNTRKGAVTLTQAEVAALGFVDTDAGSQGVGTIMLCNNHGGGGAFTINSGATIGGASLYNAGVDNTGIQISVTALAGTWRNIGAENVATTNSGTFQRIA